MPSIEDWEFIDPQGHIYNYMVNMGELEMSQTEGLDEGNKSESIAALALNQGKPSPQPKQLEVDQGQGNRTSTFFHDSLLTFRNMDVRKAPTEHPPKPSPVVTKDTKPAPKSSRSPVKDNQMAEVVRELGQEYDLLKERYDKNRHHLREADRVTEEQHRELRDLKKHNAELRELLRKENIQGEKDRLWETIEQLESNAFYHKHELHRRKVHIESLTQQTRDAIEQKDVAEIAARKLARENKNLQENLTECKDDLLRLQPPSQISDSELSEQYSSLHQQISKWVDDETEDSQLLEQRFEDLSTVKEDLPELLRKCLNNEHLRLGKKHPTSLPLILRYIIHYHLDQHIFREDIQLFGLDDHIAGILRSIELGMKKLEPPRDAKTIRHWRSETLRALSQITEFKDAQREEAIAVSKSLYHALSYLIPTAENKQDAWKELHDHIVKPAVQVAANMRLSTETYRTTSRLAGKPPDQVSMFVHEVQRCNMIDLSSHKILRPDSVLKVGEDGKIGEQMLVVQPALIRTPKEAGPNVVLCKPAMLVRLDEPMGRKSKGIKALQQWLVGEGSA